MNENGSGDDSFRFRCSECRQKLRVNKDAAGKWMLCPSCESVVEIPSVRIVVSNCDDSTLEMIPNIIDSCAKTVRETHAKILLSKEDCLELRK